MQKNINGAVKHLNLDQIKEVVGSIVFGAKDILEKGTTGTKYLIDSSRGIITFDRFRQRTGVIKHFSKILYELSQGRFELCLLMQIPAEKPKLSYQFFNHSSNPFFKFKQAFIIQ